MKGDNRYWFPAKKYGWGWGFPATWEGWVVFTVYFLLLFGTALYTNPQHHIIRFVLYTLALTAGLLAVCWLKGEPPRWRWGK
ncbi:MAG: hypothetical protein P8181_03325 [bacterium]